MENIIPTVAIELVIGAIFGLWTAAAVVESIPHTQGMTAPLLGSLGSIVPRYNFFAPTPGTDDYYVVYRDRTADGSVSDWKIPEGITQTPDRLQWLWNPHMAPFKAVHDTMQGLALAMEFEQEGAGNTGNQKEKSGNLNHSPDNSEDLQRSVNYLTLLEVVTAQPHEPETEETQFALMAGSKESENYHPEFVSKYHSI